MASHKTPVRRRLEPTVRQGEILDATEALVAAHGYRGVTVDEVAVACGMTRAGLLHHFPSKAELLIGLLRRRDSTDAADLEARFSGNLSRADVRTALADLVARNRDQEVLIRLYTVLSAEALDPDHPAHDYFKDRLARSRRTLAAISAPWHPDPDAFALAVLAFMDGLQLNWLRDPSIDPCALWERYAEELFGDG